MHHDGHPKTQQQNGNLFGLSLCPVSLSPPTSPVLGSAQACASAAHRMRARGCRGEGTERRQEVPSRRLEGNGGGIEAVEESGSRGGGCGAGDG